MIPNSLRIQRKQIFFFMFMDLKICYLILHLFSSSFSYWKPHMIGGPWLFISKSWGIHKADWNLKSYVWAVYQRRALLLANPVGLLCWRSSDVIFRSFLLAWSDSLDKSPAISCPQYGNLSPKEKGEVKVSVFTLHPSPNRPYFSIIPCFQLFLMRISTFSCPETILFSL